MKLDGTIHANLESAISSAKRLRGHPVYPDTLLYWQQLVSEARRTSLSENGSQPGELDALIIKLENELADRSP